MPIVTRREPGGFCVYITFFYYVVSIRQIKILFYSLESSGSSPSGGEASSTERLKSGAGSAIEMARHRRADLRPTELRPTDLAHSLTLLPVPNKKTRTVFTVRAPILQSNSLLAVTFLDGYVVSAILVPDLH